MGLPPIAMTYHAPHATQAEIDQQRVAQTPPPLPRKRELADDIGMRMLMPVGRSGWAIAAGYAGLFALVVIPAPLALILGIIAVWDIRKSMRTDRPKYGMGRAIFGLATGFLGTAFMVTMLIIASVSGK